MYKEYLPVDPDFYDIIDNLKNKGNSILIHYFSPDNELDDARGIIKGLITNPSREKYLALDSGDNIRLDRIIALNGRPGPAYDEYDAYALACLDCRGTID